MLSYNYILQKWDVRCCCRRDENMSHFLGDDLVGEWGFGGTHGWVYRFWACVGAIWVDKGHWGVQTT